MGWKNLDDVWVSDMSSFSDFGLEDEQLDQISADIRVPVENQDLLCDTVTLMALRSKES